MATLGPAVSSLRASLNLLDSSISILDEGVSDLPRLRKVLQTQRHFELVPESTLKAAQQSLADEISPAIEQLLTTADAYVNQLSRKEQSLKARHELLEGRLASQSTSQKKAKSSSKLQSGSQTQSGNADARAQHMKRLQQKQDQLQFAIDRLELQGKQRERELRKSMAFVRDDD